MSSIDQSAHLLNLYTELARRKKEQLRVVVQNAALKKVITPEVVEAYAAVHLKDADNHDMPIVAARHHRLWLHFLCDEKIPRLMIIAPFGSAKTTWILSAYVGCYIGIFPERSVIIGCGSADTAAKRSMALRSGALSEDFRKTFPDLRPDPALPWVQDQWTLMRHGKPQANRLHPTLAAYGVGDTKTIGARANLIIPDDLLNFSNTRTAHQRNEVDQWMQSTLMSRISAKTGRIAAVGTSWNQDDYYATAKKQGGWVVVHMPQLSDTKEFYCTITYPDNFPKDRMIGEQIGDTEYAAN